jgi:hypothetical protein
MGNYSESRENQNVNLRMSKESEQMLVKDRISPTRRVKERSIEVTICEKYSDSACQYGKG